MRVDLRLAWLKFTPQRWAGLSDYVPRVPWISRDIVAASLALNLLALALPLVILQVYDRILPNQATDTLLMLVIGLSITTFLDICLTTSRSYLSGWAGARFEHEAGCIAIDRLLDANINHIEHEAAGVHLDRLGAVDPVRDFYSSQASLLIVDLGFVLVYLGLLAVIAGWLVFAPLLLMAIFGIAAFRLGEKLRAALANRATWDDRRYNFIIELLTGIHSIKAAAMEAQMMRRYERLQESTAKAGYQVSYLGGLAQGMGSIFSQLTVITAALAGAGLVIDGRMSIGALAASTMLASRALQPLLRALGLWTQFQGVRIAERHLAEIYKIPSESPADVPEIGDLQGGIELDRVSFSYAGDHIPLIDDASLHVAPGEFVAINGGNSCGKSTLLWLMKAGAMPNGGAIRYDGRDMRGYQLASIRRQIAYLPTRGVMFQGTVLQNMTMFRDDRIDAALDLAARLGLDRVFAVLPKGYDTRVGDTSCDTLPAGVTQRIAIVRALADDANIILFDEANNALDRDSDVKLARLLEEYRGRKTIVMVTYRPSLLKLASRVYCLADGRLAEEKPAALPPQPDGPPLSPLAGMPAPRPA